MEQVEQVPMSPEAPSRSPVRSSRPPRAAFLPALAFGMAASAIYTSAGDLRAQEADPVEEADPTLEAVTSERCKGPEHRQFDFWLGDWEVRDPDGRLVGHNSITRVAGGCGLLERWRAAEGDGSGASINMYEPDRGVWTQTWAGTGSFLHVTGGLKGESMVMSGDRPRQTPRGDVLDRITWTPLADGRVRQHWEVSSDGGETWRTIFVGLYERIGAGR